VIHNGCDLTRFDPTRQAPVALRNSLDFSEGDRILLVVGRLETQKGHRVLLDAMPFVRRRFPAVRLVCVGDGALRGQLEAQAAALGILESVRFVGYRSDMPDWLALADAVVLPSFFEGLPLIAIESLAAGRPMVATAVDGTPEVVVDGKTGLTVPPGDPGLLAEALGRLLGDPGLGRALSRAGRTWVEEHFSQEGQVQRTQDFYLQAAARSCRLRCGSIKTIAKEPL
jgi:glycosyltransferase involved in cell wall biosynthesis